VYRALHSLAFLESSVNEMMVDAPNWFNAPLQMSTTDAIYFFQPFFIALYAFLEIVDLDLGLDVPAFFLLLIFPTSEFFIIILLSYLCLNDRGIAPPTLIRINLRMLGS
jgi:hypothetical protein